MGYHTGAFVVLDQHGREWVAQGKRDQEIARLIGCSSSLVAHWRSARNVKAIPCYPHSERLNTIGKRLYDAGHSDVYIAKTIGCSTPNVRAWRVARDLPANWIVGSDDWYASIDNRKREEASRAVEDGLTDREAADRLGITRTAFAFRRRRLGLKPNKQRLRKACTRK